MPVVARQRIALAVIRSVGEGRHRRREILLTRQPGETMYGLPSLDYDPKPGLILRNMALELWSKLAISAGVVSPSPFLLRVEGRDSSNELVEDCVFVGSFYDDPTDKKPHAPNLEWIWASYREADEDLPLSLTAVKTIKKLREEMYL